MFAAIAKLFAAKPRHALPARKDLVASIEALAAERGMPVPDNLGRLNRQELMDAVAALRNSPAADLAAEDLECEPTAAALNGEPPLDEGQVYRMALADAIASGLSRSAAHADALYAARRFTAGNTEIRPLPSKPSTRPAAKPSARPTAPKTAAQATTTRNQAMPYSYASTPPPATGDKSTVTAHSRSSPYASVEERIAHNPPVPAPLPTAPWGSVEWSNQFFRFLEGLTPPARQSVQRKFPDLSLDVQIAEAVRTWELRRLEVLEAAKKRKYYPL